MRLTVPATMTRIIILSSGNAYRDIDIEPKRERMPVRGVDL